MSIIRQNDKGAQLGSFIIYSVNYYYYRKLLV